MFAKLDTKRLHLLVGVCTLALGYGFGRYVAPDKVHEVVKEDTASREQVKALTAQLEAFQKNTHRVEVVTPDGTRRVVTDTRIDRTKDTRSSVEAAKTETKTVTVDRLVDKARPSWRAGPMVGFDFRTHAPAYGGMVERRIAGPLSLGVFGLSNGTAGASLTLEF